MSAIIDGLIARSTASGWLLCIIVVGGIIKITRVIADQRPKMKDLETAEIVATKGLEITESTALRDAFVGEMHALREEIRGLREETKHMRDENGGLRSEIKNLREENHGLRNEVRALHGIIDGMRRENLQAGISTQRAVVESLPRDFVPEKTREALDRMQGTGE